MFWRGTNLDSVPALTISSSIKWQLESTLLYKVVANIKWDNIRKPFYA